VESLQRAAVARAAEAILDRGGWCVVEACLDVAGQRWDPQVLVCSTEAEVVVDAVFDEVWSDPTLDVRLAGCDRGTLAPDPDLGTHLCHLAAMPVAAGGAVPLSRLPPTSDGRNAMLVKDAMNPIVVSVGPGHTLREAAKRMTARGVGAAVVLDNDQPGPTIITERDILHSISSGEDPDKELVAEHLTADLTFASPEWSLEHAAGAMTRGGFRHLIVVEGGDLVGVLSMRDIVRVWIGDGATCEVPAGSAGAPAARG